MSKIDEALKMIGCPECHGFYGNDFNDHLEKQKQALLDAVMDALDSPQTTQDQIDEIQELFK